jgi:hypothetical protein
MSEYTLDQRLLGPIRPTSNDQPVSTSQPDGLHSNAAPQLELPVNSPPILTRDAERGTSVVGS